MFNSYESSVSNHVNAVSGNIVKTYKESWFERFHLRSNYAEKLFKRQPSEDHITKPPVVIQMVLCGDMEVVAELMAYEDYQKIFEEEVEEGDFEKNQNRKTTDCER